MWCYQWELLTRVIISEQIPCILPVVKNAWSMTRTSQLSVSMATDKLLLRVCYKSYPNSEKQQTKNLKCIFKIEKKKRKYDYLWHILACSKYSVCHFLICSSSIRKGYLGILCFLFHHVSAVYTLLGFFSVSMLPGGRYISLWEFEF